MAKPNAEIILDANIQNQTDELNNLLGKGDENIAQLNSCDKMNFYINEQKHAIFNQNDQSASIFRKNTNYLYDVDRKLVHEQHLDEYFKMMEVKSVLENNRQHQLNTKLSLNATPFVPKKSFDNFKPCVGDNNDQRLNQPRRIIKKSLLTNTQRQESKIFSQNFSSAEKQNDINQNSAMNNKKYNNSFKNTYQYDKDYYEFKRDINEELNIRNLNIGPQFNYKTPSIKMFEKLKSCWIFLNYVINEHAAIEILLTVPITSYKMDQLIEEQLFKNNNLYLILQKTTEILYYEIFSLETLFIKLRIIFHEHSIAFVDGSKEIIYELLECFEKLKSPKTIQYFQTNAMINDISDAKIIFNNFDEFLNILKYTNSYVWSLREIVVENINKIKISKNRRNIFIGN